MHKNKEKDFSNIIESTIAGIGAFLAIVFLGILSEQTGTIMIIAPLGATAVLLYSAPNSPFSKPLNIFSSYLISTILGMIILKYSGGSWFPVGIGLALTIIMMHLLKVIHPAAGANYLIVTQGELSFVLLGSTFIGLVILIIISIYIEKIRKKFLLLDFGNEL